MPHDWPDRYHATFPDDLRHPGEIAKARGGKSEKYVSIVAHSEIVHQGK